MAIALSQTQHYCGLQDNWLARKTFAKRIESVARKTFRRILSVLCNSDASWPDEIDAIGSTDERKFIAKSKEAI